MLLSTLYRAAQRFPFLLAGAAALPTLAQAQPTIVSTAPAANSRAASPTAAVKVTFSQPLLATAGPALRVYSAQRGTCAAAARPRPPSAATR